MRHTYRLREDAEDKSAHWGEQLWNVLAAETSLELPSYIVDREDYGYVRTRLLNHLVTRLVIRAKQAHARTDGLPDDVRDDAIREAVDEVVSLPEDRQRVIAYLLAKIVDRVARRGAFLSPVQRGRVLSFARRRRHRCYICGRRLFYGSRTDEDAQDDVLARRAFELDHLFPQARGGSRGADNLSACCEGCNKLKDDHLSFADLPIETSQTASLDPAEVARTFHRRIEFALLWRQLGACARCGTKFHDAADERLFLVRRNARDAYHFMNVEIACGECEDGGLLGEGIRIRD